MSVSSQERPSRLPTIDIGRKDSKIGEERTWLLHLREAWATGRCRRIAVAEDGGCEGVTQRIGLEGGRWMDVGVKKNVHGVVVVYNSRLTFM